MKHHTNSCRLDGYQPLQDELERRYGPGLVQELIDQIRRAESANFSPDYMPVKAASEILETLRADTKAVLQGLKARRKAPNHSSVAIDLCEARLQRDLEALLPVYLMAQKGFYRLYKRTLAAYTEEAPATRHYKRLGREPEMAMAA